MKSMSYFFALLTTLTSTLSAAATAGYEIKSDLFFNGKKDSSVTFIVKENEPGLISQKTENGHTFVEVIAKEGEIQGNKGILMTFTIGRIDEYGKKIVLARPQVLTRDSQKASVSQQGETGKEAISLTVTPHRKML